MASVQPEAHRVFVAHLTGLSHISSLDWLIWKPNSGVLLEGEKIVRRVLFALAAVAIVALGLVFIAPLFISTENLQKRALAQVESATGYRLRIDGPVKIAVFPSLDLVAHDVGIAQPDQNGGAEFATVRTLRFGLVLRGLLAGKVNFTEVKLIDPVIRLPLPENAARHSAKPVAKKSAAQEELSIHELTIRNGKVILPGENGEPDKQINALNAEASLPSASGPLNFDAIAKLDGDPISAKGTIRSFAHFLDGGSVPVKLALETPNLPDRATLTGTASYKGGILTLAQFSAQSGLRKITGDATYHDDTLEIDQGIFDDTPFAGTAHLAGDALTVDTEVSLEGKSIRLAGTLDAFDRFVTGGEALIKFHIMAPEYAKDEVRLNGAVSYKDDALIVPKFTALSGEDTISGTAVYKNDVLTLSQVAATFGDHTITGDATYRGDAVDLDVTVDLDRKPAKVRGSVIGIEKLVDGAPASVKLEIESPDRLPAKAIVTGDAIYKDDSLVLNGFTAASGDYTITGNGVYKDEVFVLDPVKAQTSGQTASGTLTVNLTGDVPSVTGTLTATGAVKSKGDGAPSLKETGTQPAAETETVPAPTEPTANPLAQPPGGVEVAVAPPPKLQETVRGEPAPSTKQTRQGRTPRGAGWRVEKLGILALKDLNVDLNLTLDQFVFEDIRINAATVKATLVDGKLTAETNDLNAYGGGGSMTLVLNANGPQSLKLVVAGLDAYPFLSDVADFHTIEGKAAITLALTASGDNERAMVSSLNGTAKFEFTDGVLRGLNVTNMLRNLTTGILTGWQYQQDTKTAFNKLSASFKVANGHAQTDDLRLIGPLVSVGGAGSVDIPAQRLKFRVNPFMLASVKGQSGKNNTLGFPVPIAVLGPWDNPSIYPDIVGVLENPVAAYQQLNKLGGGLISMPTNILGVDTGDGGLVEKSIAIPGAVTKGVVSGIGQMLGVKKQGEADGTPSAPTTKSGDTTPTRSEAPPQERAAEVAPKEKSGAESTPFQNIFGQ